MGLIGTWDLNQPGRPGAVLAVYIQSGICDRQQPNTHLVLPH